MNFLTWKQSTNIANFALFKEIKYLHKCYSKRNVSANSCKQ